MEKGIWVAGNPQGAEILYLEDYVYSFMKITLLERSYKRMKVLFLGDERTENQKHYYYVSGMIFEESEKSYFEGEEQLGEAVITMLDEMLVIQLKNKKDEWVEFKDYYIYYAENENMKKYMLSFAVQPLNTGNGKEKKDDAIKVILPIKKGGMVNVLKYMAIVFVAAYIIISMNHYCKLEQVAERVVYIIDTISQEDTFYMP